MVPLLLSNSSLYLSQDMEIAGIEDDPDFWNMMDDQHVEVVPVRDLTKGIYVNFLSSFLRL